MSLSTSLATSGSQKIMPDGLNSKNYFHPKIPKKYFRKFYKSILGSKHLIINKKKLKNLPK
jgi:hypothetical protein